MAERKTPHPEQAKRVEGRKMPVQRGKTALALKRVYDPPAAEDGTRILVDRLWPRGLAKAKAHVDLWLRDLAPSDALRKRFHHRPAAWDQFRAAYAAELAQPAAQAAVKELRARLRRGPVTLLYAARDPERNNAVALREWLRPPRRPAARDRLPRRRQS